MKNLKALRSQFGISQQKLAEAVGSTQQAIHRYEHEDYEPDIATMVEIAKFFNTSVDYLIGNTDIQRKIEKLEKYDLNSEEAKLINKYRMLAPALKKSTIIIVDSFSENL